MIERVRSITDMVMGMVPGLRTRPSPVEQDLAVHLRGNENLLSALRDLIDSRIKARAALALPSTPQECQISMTRDRELQWLVGRLEYVYHSPVSQGNDEQGEQPAD